MEQWCHSVRAFTTVPCEWALAPGERDGGIVTLLFDSILIHFLAFIPVYDYEKRVMNDKYASCVYIDIVYSERLGL